MLTAVWWKLNTSTIYLLTYLLTPWCRVLEKQTGLQLVKKFPALHVTRMFITALTSLPQPSLSSARPIQAKYPQRPSWCSILILSTHLRLGLPSGLLPSGFPSKTLYTHISSPYTPHAQPISFFSMLSSAQYWVRSTNHLAPRYATSSIPPVTSSLLGPNILLNTIFSNTLRFLSSRNVSDQVSHPYRTRQNYSSIYFDL